MQTLTTRKRRARRGGLTALAVSLGLVGASLAAAPAQAQSNPYQKGPDPTQQSITAASGSFAVSEGAITGARGFGGGRWYAPNDTSKGTFGVIALSPGFTASWSSIGWLGKRLASQGFVVIGIETSTRLDQPYQRGQQLVAALDWAINSSQVGSKIDRNRQAVGGHSMGGGGTLEASRLRKSMKAGVPIAPWNLTKSWSDLSTPIAIVGGQSDVIAPVGSHSVPFYNSLRSPKAYLELRGESHFFPQFVNAHLQGTMVAWYKRYLDNDTRYTKFLTPGPGTSTSISSYRVSGVS